MAGDGVVHPWAEERLVPVVHQPLGEGAEPLGVHLPALGHGHSEDDRGAPAGEPVLEPFGVGIPDRGVEPPVAVQLPARDERRDRHRAERIAIRRGVPLHDEAALRQPAVLAGCRQLEPVEDARLVEGAAIERALPHFHTRDDVALRADAVVGAESPFPPLGRPVPDEQLGVVVGGQAERVVDVDVRPLDQAATGVDAEGGRREGVTIGVELEGGRTAGGERRGQNRVGHGTGAAANALEETAAHGESRLPRGIPRLGRPASGGGETFSDCNGTACPACRGGFQ